MFQRLKGFNLDSFLDSKIAEEQEKQKGGQPSGVKRTPSAARRPNGRNDSPATRPSSRLRNTEVDRGVPVGRGPDPSEFIIDDDDTPSRTATPKPQVKDEEEIPVKEGHATEGQPAEKAAEPVSRSQEKAMAPLRDGEPTPDVQAKLRKLQKLENKYQDLLRSYRVAHARVSAIEPFEASLRENTPLTSISDPTALVEYLSQVSLKGDMVMDELKRVSGDRDSLKVKLDEAEKKTKEAYDEAAGLRTERDERLTNTTKLAQTDNHKSTADPLGVTNGDGKSDNAQDPASRDGDDDFFSYEVELPRLQNELEEKSQVIERLNDENVLLRGDLAAARSSLQDTTQKVETTQQPQAVDLEDIERERAELEARCNEAELLIRESTATLDTMSEHLNVGLEDQKSLPLRIAKLVEVLQSAQSASKKAEEELKEWKIKSETSVKSIQDHESRYTALQESMNTVSSSDKLRADTLNKLVVRLRSQLKVAEAAKQDAEDKGNELKLTQASFEAKDELRINRLIVDVQSLQDSVSRAERERDDAYQVILDCGHCGVVGLKSSSPSNAVSAEVEGALADKSATPAIETEVSAAAEGDITAAKKKSKGKKKNKGKSTAAATSSAPAKSNATEKPDGTAEKSQESPLLPTDSWDAKVSAIKAHAAAHNGSHANCDKTIKALNDTIGRKDIEIEQLYAHIETKTQAIDRLDARLKGEEDLREEIEGLKDDLMHVGNEHVAAKDQLKTLRDQIKLTDDQHNEVLKTLQHQLEAKAEEYSTAAAEIETLKSTSGSSSKELEDKISALAAEKTTLEGQVARYKEEVGEWSDKHASANRQYKSLLEDFDNLKSSMSVLQTDLSAANELSQSRYKDLTSLREHLSKVTPELNNVKNECTRLQGVIEELNKDNSKLPALETKSSDLQSEVTTLRKKIHEKDVEIMSLNGKLKESNGRASSLEEKEHKATKSLARSETQQKEASAARDQLIRELAKAQEELQTARKSLEVLEQQTEKLGAESRAAREELQLKSAQQASAQSLMDSMQDQTRELATQMKEVRERCESLEEELADAHRLLSERSREGETMRRLLADVEGRADARIKEMRDRMDLAIEERDRAEDDASAAGRRKAREVDDLRSKLKEVERERADAVEEKEAFEKRESGFHSLRESLEKRAVKAQEELVEVRAAMSKLRDALDEGERQAREVEKEKAELERIVDDKEKRLEKLQKSSKVMADELRALQTSSKSHQPSVASTRSSLESSRVASPARKGSVATTGGPDAQPTTDYVYLKNVLLQFLEQKDKKHQMQLVPVLGMLLHFDRKDEQKWMSAITAKS